jgi:hypothetical protein
MIHLDTARDANMSTIVKTQMTHTPPFKYPQATAIFVELNPLLKTIKTYKQVFALSQTYV